MQWANNIITCCCCGELLGLPLLSQFWYALSSIRSLGMGCRQVFVSISGISIRKFPWFNLNLKHQDNVFIRFKIRQTPNDPNKKKKALSWRKKDNNHLSWLPSFKTNSMAWILGSRNSMVTKYISPLYNFKQKFHYSVVTYDTITSKSIERRWNLKWE